MRLTTELIRSALSYINPLSDRELDLRGNKIPVIENLGVAGAQDAIDFTDNDITTLGNFPRSPRLHTLLLARNRVQHIQAGLARSLPRLQTLVLTQNNISELADLDPLAECKELAHLVLMDNPVTLKENYRYYLIWRIPSLHDLDFAKVRDSERTHAAELFGTLDEPSPLATKIMGIKSAAPVAVSQIANGMTGATKRQKVAMTEKEKRRVAEMIQNARSLQEVARLEKMLAEGRIPGGVLGDDD